MEGKLSTLVFQCRVHNNFRTLLSKNVVPVKKKIDPRIPSVSAVELFLLVIRGIKVKKILLCSCSTNALYVCVCFKNAFDCAYTSRRQKAQGGHQYRVHPSKNKFFGWIQALATYWLQHRPVVSHAEGKLKVLYTGPAKHDVDRIVLL